WASVIRRQIPGPRRDPDALDQAWPPLGTGGLFGAFFWGQPPDMDRLAAEMGYPVRFESHQLIRGLVGRLTLETAEFLEVGQALVAWGPVPAITLTNVTPHLE